MENLGTMKVSENFKKFLRRFQAYRVSEEIEDRATPLCFLPDIIVKYFKQNNDRYLELVNMEIENGTN